MQTTAFQISVQVSMTVYGRCASKF